MSGTFNSNTNATPVEPSSKVQDMKDLMDQPITPLPVTPMAPKPDDPEHPILASSTDGAQDTKDPNSESFRPQVFRRQSNNYEDAAKAAQNSSSHTEGQPPVSSAIQDLLEGSKDQKGPDNVAGDWQPKFVSRGDRQPSFDHQDWKHETQMKVAGKEKKDDDNTALGFTEAGSGQS